MIKITSIHRYLKNCNKILFIFLMFVLSLLVTIILSPVFDLFDTTIEESFSSEVNTENVVYEFFTAVIIAPFVETLIFQFLVIEFLYLTKMGKKKIIVLSAILFSAIHYFSIGYILYAFSMGVILSYSYVIQKSTSQAFLTVFAIHLLRNALAFSLRIFGN